MPWIYEGCQIYAMPVGTLSFGEGPTSMDLDIRDQAVYAVGCPNGTVISDEFIADFFTQHKAPFYGSIAPLVYTIAGATSLAWLLLLLLLISEKQRPLLQKFAACFVASSLTAILTNITSTLRDQYDNGYFDSFELRNEVLGNVWVDVLSVLLTLVILLAHIQVVLRLFNRAKEKFIIEAVGLTLTALNVVFWCLAMFATDRNQALMDTRFGILAFTFEMAIEVTYCLGVLLFSFQKRRYAYTRHTYSIAILSVATLLSPIFFLCFLIPAWAASWATHATAVMNTAATVVVWDWIDAIEAQEKKEQKSGVMGRQIYEPDIAAQFHENLHGTGDGQGAWVGVASGKRQVRHILPLYRPYFAWRRIVKDFMVRSGSALSALTSFTTSEPANSSSGQTGGGGSGGGSAHPLPAPTPLESTSAVTPPPPTSNSSKRPIDRFVHPVKRSSRRHALDSLHETDADESYVVRDTPLSETRESARSTGTQSAAPPRTSSTQSYASSAGQGSYSGDGGLTAGAGPSDAGPVHTHVDVIAETRSIASDTVPPQLFDRHPGFEPGDYWDEKGPR